MAPGRAKSDSRESQPIHISVMDVIVDGHDVPLNMIRPFETLTLPLPANSAGGQMTGDLLMITAQSVTR